MRLRKATLAALVLTGAAVALAIVFGGGKDTERAKAATGAETGEPTVSIVSPRNGEVQPSHSVVVKVDLENFQLAPENFGGEPELGEGNLRFAPQPRPQLRRPEKTGESDQQPARQRTPAGRLDGLPRTRRAERDPRRTGRHRGQLLPATRPEIYLPRPAARLLPADRHASPRTTARRCPSTTSPTSRSCRNPATIRKSAKPATSPAPRPPQKLE